MKSEAEQGFVELLRKVNKSPEELILMNLFGDRFEKELRFEIRELNTSIKQYYPYYNDVWDLVNSKKAYPELIDILIQHIPIKYHIKNREGIFRALLAKDAIGKAAAPLIKEYNKIQKEFSNLRWVIGNTVYYTATKKELNGIIEIARDISNDWSRTMFVRALSKFKTLEVENVLIHLLSDDVVAAEAIFALGRYKSVKAKDKIIELSTHDNKIIRKEAEKFLKKF